MVESAIKSMGPAISDKVVQEYLATNFGEDAVKIIKAATENMTDDILAAKCKLKVSEVRTVLNKMHNLRLAEYTRIKDKDTGWYSYVWHVDLKNIYGVLDEIMRTEISHLNQQMEDSTTILSYICSKCSKNNVIDFDLASRLSFRCPHCSRRLYEKRDSQAGVEDKLNDLKQKHTSLVELMKRKEEMKRVAEMKRLEVEQKVLEAAKMKIVREEAKLAKAAVKASNKVARMKAKALKQKELAVKKMNATAMKKMKATAAKKSKSTPRTLKPIKKKRR